MFATNNVKLSIEAGGYFNIALLALISIDSQQKKHNPQQSVRFSR